MFLWLSDKANKHAALFQQYPLKVHAVGLFRCYNRMKCTKDKTLEKLHRMIFLHASPAASFRIGCLFDTIYSLCQKNGPV